MRRPVFPFSAIVGQEGAKLALLCCAVDPTIGGVLLSGDKGTGKSTLVRAFAQVLPEIEVVADCPFNCNPRNELEMCDSCLSTMERGGELKVLRRKMRVVDLPLNITVDRLVGTIDIKRAVTEGVRAFQPGLLAEANRNILYIDEVNLLDDYVADVLLDAAAMGWNIVEREGISIRHPARFILVGSMNPEEGELRPQILDRFGLYVKVEASKNPGERAEIVRRVEEFHRDPVKFYEKYEGEEERVRGSIERARELVERVEVGDDLLNMLMDTVIKLDVKTHRAEIVTTKTAKAIAALEGRTKVTVEDLKRAMELALPHRLRARPFEAPRPLEPLLENPNSVDQLQDKGPEGDTNPPLRGAPSNKLSLNQHLKRELDDQAPGERERLFKAAQVEINVGVERGINPLKTSASVRRGSRAQRATVIGHPQGHPVSYALPSRVEQLRDLDLTATLNAAATRQRSLPLIAEESDLRVKVRKARTPRLSVIVLDASGSMGVLRRMSIAKGIARELAENSYRKRDLIALLTFRGRQADVVVPPTKRYSDVVDVIEKLPTGGRTPLPLTLHQLLLLAKSFKAKNKNAVVKGILITDGKGNVPLWNNVEEDVKSLALMLKKHGVQLEIYDTRPKGLFEPAPSYIELIAETTNAKVCSVA